MKLNLPIPKENLITRFSGVFEKLKNDQNVTLVALPYSGRTSLLRYIVNQSEILSWFQLPSNHRILWLETENAGHKIINYLSAILLSFDPNFINHPIFLTRDEFVLQNLLKSKVIEVANSGPLTLVVSLGWKDLELVSEVDQIFSSFLKRKLKFPLTILWSIDTAVYRQPTIHPSSTVFENIIFFPTYDHAETIHNIKRTTKLKGKDITLVTAYKDTGGVAGLFHSFINHADNLKNLPIFTEVITLLKDELSKSVDLKKQLTTPVLETLLATAIQSSYPFESLMLKRVPTAQEILILRTLLSKINYVVTRDDLAKVIWGTNWEKKYSDWAIDKLVSRVRNLISPSIQKIVTVRSLGYQLICL